MIVMFEKLKTAVDISRNGDSLSIPAILWALLFGIIISWFIIFFNRRVTGSFIRALIAAEAFAPETAKSPADLSVTLNSDILRSYKRSSSVRRIISAVFDETESNTRILDENTKFYISESNLTRAKALYANNGGSPWTLALGSVALIVLGIIITIIYCM